MAKIANVQEVSLKKLKPYERNAKKHGEDQIEKLKASINEFGFLTPCLIDNDFNLIAGHGRVMAAKELGIESVPCVFIEGLSEEQRRAYILADNRLGELGEWDMDIVWDELSELDELGFDVELTGFEMLEEIPEVIEDDFDESAVPDEPRSKLGDLWQLGDHRLICGDSTDVNVIDRLMDGVKADMVFTDPPYNIDFKGSMSNTTKNGVMIKHKGANQRHDSIKNDRMTKEDFYNFICQSLDIIKENVKGAWYISFSSANIEELLNPLRDKKMDWKSIIIWMKNQATLSMKDYKSRYEPIVYGRFNDVFYGEKAKEEDIWEFQRTLKNDLHPTMKPVPLICNMIKMSSKENDCVIDLFGGSGSTLIACEQLNRKCYMCELDPHYCDVIISRWETLTGREAVLING